MYIVTYRAIFINQVIVKIISSPHVTLLSRHGATLVFAAASPSLLPLPRAATVAGAHLKDGGGGEVLHRLHDDNEVPTFLDG